MPGTPRITMSDHPDRFMSRMVDTGCGDSDTREGVRRHNYRSRALFYRQTDDRVFIIRNNTNTRTRLANSYSSSLPPSSYAPNGFAGSTM